MMVPHTAWLPHCGIVDIGSHTEVGKDVCTNYYNQQNRSNLLDNRGSRGMTVGNLVVVGIAATGGTGARAGVTVF